MEKDIQNFLLEMKHGGAQQEHTLHNKNHDNQFFQTKLRTLFQTMEMKDVLEIYAKAEFDQLLEKRYQAL